jgi:hypothetical protein
VQQGRAVWHVKVFAIGKAVPQITDEDREGKHTLQLYLDGKIEQFYFTQDKLGVVFLMLVESVDKANATVDALPLAAGGFLNYEFLPVGPLAPFSQLHGWATRSPTDASPSPSRVPTHGSGPMRIATPSPWWTFSSYSLPVLTGAPNLLFPPVSAFCTHLLSAADIFDHRMGRALILFGVDAFPVERWTREGTWR